MRVVGLLSALLAVVLLAGCGTEAPRQAGARVAVEASLESDDYSHGKTRCTDNPSAWFIERDTEVFICAARRRDGGCDWFRATLKNAGWEVVLDERNAGCILPF